VQALDDLLQLPSVVASFITQQLSRHSTPQAIGVSGPGHCIWQLKKLLGGGSGPSVPLRSGVAVPAAPEDTFECAPYHMSVPTATADARAHTNLPSVLLARDPGWYSASCGCVLREGDWVLRMWTTTLYV
jgi:hypothetical protein